MLLGHCEMSTKYDMKRLSKTEGITLGQFLPDACVFMLATDHATLCGQYLHLAKSTLRPNGAGMRSKCDLIGSAGRPRLLLMIDDE